MSKPKNPTNLARKLRRNSTEVESKLWNLLRRRQLSNYRFRRQHPVGKYIVDFACVQYRLIIEADGGQHADNPQDVLRTEYLEKLGWKVMRFWNHEILTNGDGVLEVILDSLSHREEHFSKS